MICLYTWKGKNAAAAPSNHKLSRKKRRRQEAMKDIAADREHDREVRAEAIAKGDSSDDYNKSKPLKNKKNIGIENEKLKAGKTISEMGAMREIKKRSRLQLEGQSVSQ